MEWQPIDELIDPIFPFFGLNIETKKEYEITEIDKTYCDNERTWKSRCGMYNITITHFRQKPNQSAPSPE